MADGIINGERATSCVALSAHLGCCMPSCVPTEAEGVGAINVGCDLNRISKGRFTKSNGYWLSSLDDGVSSLSRDI